MIPTTSKLVNSDDNSFGVSEIENKLWVSSNPTAWDIASGKVPGRKSLSKFGHQSDISQVLQEVWDYDLTYTYMTTASTLYISSDNATDTQNYEVQGLDENWEEKTVQVAANGFSFVPLDGLWIRVFRAKNLGTTDNAGNIYISDDNTDVGGNGIPDTVSNIKAMITASYNQTLMALWSVPDGGTTAYLTSFYGSTSSQRGTEIHLYVRPFGGVFQIKKLITIFAGSERMIYDFPLQIPAKSDIAIKAIAAAGGDSEVSAGFDLWYEE
jgi:hypothetical protein